VFRYLTAGESHGPALVGILDGIPARLRLDVERINAELTKRQGGYGRGGRMKIERDQVEFLAGVRGSYTLGSPIAVMVRNRDFENVRELMDPITGHGKQLTNPRPGHADYAGALKYRHRDLRNVLERASARETAMRVALGAICAQLLLRVPTCIASGRWRRRSSTTFRQMTWKAATFAVRIRKRPRA
jgi:chorismate synthase